MILFHRYHPHQNFPSQFRRFRLCLRFHQYHQCHRFLLYLQCHQYLLYLLYLLH
jgi:hypothetical protein